MLNNKDIQDITVPAIKRLIMDREYKSPPNSPLNDILGVERNVHTKVHGLFTAMGTFWEQLVKELAPSNGFKISDPKIFKVPGNAPRDQNPLVDSIITSRKENYSEYNAENSHSTISNMCKYYIDNPCTEDKWVKPASGTGVDIYLRKENTHYLFDTKTVKPNVSNLNSFLGQLHMWYWYAYSRFPKDKVYARIVFPYNPYKTDFKDNIIKRGKPLLYGKEWLDANNFWELITGNPNAENLIMESFKIASNNNELKTFLKNTFPETR